MKTKFSIILMFLSVLFFSCSNIFNERHEGSVTVDVANAARYVYENSLHAYEDFDEPDFPIDDGISPEMFDLIKYNLVVKLSTEGDYKTTSETRYTMKYLDMGDYESEASAEIEAMKSPVTIKAIPVGSKIKVRASISVGIIIDENLMKQLLAQEGMPAEYQDYMIAMMKEMYESEFAEIASGISESFEVQSGNNPIKIPLTFSEDFGEELGNIPVTGGIELPEFGKTKIVKNEAYSDTEFYLNKGKLQFNLIDENGKDVSEIKDDLGAGFGADSIVGWIFELRLGNQLIPETGSGDLVYWKSTGEGNFEIINLPKGGQYQLYVQAFPYSNTQKINEVTSAVFEFEVQNSKYFSYSVDPNGENYIALGDQPNDRFEELKDAIWASNVALKLYGTSEITFEQAVSQIKFIANDSSYNISFDFSEFENSDSTTISGSLFAYWHQLTAIILPENITALIGEDTQETALFAGCESLKLVVFPKTENWYSSSEKIENLSDVDWTSLTPEDVSSATVNASKLKSQDGWKYLYRKVN